ncbi:protein kinase [Haloferula chungangensis]|uniref:Protein kinase n=1 Tax=Haloferula chungangensis TaxID=1048331 RepID=A0ABW2L592_9BACT
MTDLEIFHNAPAGATETEMSAYLDEACGEDADLRQKVEALLAMGEKQDDFLEDVPLQGSSFAAREATMVEGPGDVIGNYKLLQELGVGGFGTVFMADQLRPVKRRVALKVIKLGMDTRQVIARFEAERQALAMMDHPNIARVFDAGATDTGRPFFVMELVRGVPITAFCEQHTLDREARLELFIEVCRAVQHAHQKGIIHRDLKPSNVMVTMHDDRAVPKVIDFGVAKATQGELTDKTLFTRYEQFIGTPAYMSPEQAQLSGLDIDTRSDVYALGVLLYELLTGTTPFDSKELGAIGQDEVRRVIREREPPRPSTRVRTLDPESLTGLAEGLREDPEQIGRGLRNDLDWIVMKALEKDRMRRYETANALARDVQRHLDDQPVEASPPSMSYRLQKLARRNRKIIAGTAGIATLLLVGSVVSTVLAINYKEAERLALTEGQAAEGARKDAEAARDKAAADELVANLRFVEQLLEGENQALGVAHLAKLQRENPGDPVITNRLVAALSQKSFPRMLVPPMMHPHRRRSITVLSEDGNLVLTAGGKMAQVWDARTGQPLGETMTVVGEDSLIAHASFDSSGNRVLVSGGALQDGFAQVFDWASGDPLWERIRGKGLIEFSCLSPDGQWVLTGMQGGKAAVWNAETGLLQAEYTHAYLNPSLSRSIVGGQFGPDSKRVATCDLGGTVAIWSFADGKAELVRPTFRPTEVRSAQFNGRGDRIVTWSDDGVVELWSATDDNKLGQSSKQGGKIVGVEFSPDPEGKKILTACADGTTRILDGVTGAQLGAPIQHASELNWVTWHPRGDRFITVTVDGDFQVWDLATRQPVGAPFIISGRSPTASFSPDGTRLIVGSGRAVRILAAPAADSSGVLLHHYKGKEWQDWDGWICNADFDASGKRLVTGGSDGAVRVWDSRNGRLEANLGGGVRIMEVRISRDGSRVHAVTQARGLVETKLGSAGAWQPLTDHRTNQAGVFMNTIALSPDEDSSRVAGVRYLNGTAILANALTGETIRHELRHGAGQNIRFVAFSPGDGRLLSVANDGVESTLRWWDPDSGELVDEWSVDGVVDGCRFNPDGTRLVLCNDAGSSVWDVSEERMLYKVPHPTDWSELTPDPNSWSIFTADGKYLVTWSSDGTARMWKAETGEPHGPPLRHRQAVSWVSSDSDGQRLVTASYDGTARVWDVASGLPLSEPLPHRARVHFAEFSPDGSQVVTTAGDATACIWTIPEPPEGSAPPWLASWAEAVIGTQIDEFGNAVEVPWDERQNVKKIAFADQSEAASYYVNLVEWFYDEDPDRRPNPFTNLTRKEYAENLVKQGTRPSHLEGLRIDPTHREELRRLRKKVIQEKK